MGYLPIKKKKKKKVKSTFFVIKNPLTTTILHLLLVLEQLRMHVADDREERLHGGVVGDGSAALGVAAHAVDEDLQAALQGRQELSLVQLRMLPVLQRLLAVGGWSLIHNQGGQKSY